MDNEIKNEWKIPLLYISCYQKVYFSLELRGQIEKLANFQNFCREISESKETIFSKVERRTKSEQDFLKKLDGGT